MRWRAGEANNKHSLGTSRRVNRLKRWPMLPERWLAEGARLRARDWSGALNYIRGAAWWRIRRGSRVDPPALLVGPREGNGAAQIVASAEYCASPTLRLVTRAHAAEHEVLPVIEEFLIHEDKSAMQSVESSKGLMGRVFGAVAGRGRELSAAVSRARLVLPTTA
ncbi:hypothetical protein EVAR_47618_1 [Eumeta japonica]|uniref:Uncharacterized protein n=1 Tax=Eumeta variegata TaxID=151549 RepID=A0A4C1ZP86_EUMVA|nr:hypothetical protein EVAR_47618_1 [Eumeta japonica]